MRKAAATTKLGSGATIDGETVKSSALKQFLAGLQCAACTVAVATAEANAAAVTIAAIPGKPDIMLGSFDLATVGYAVSEYSIGGAAASFTLKGDARPDGHWTATPANTAPYKTRLVAALPSDRAKFNGTVVVEWMNVTGGLDVPVDWITTHREIIRGGYAYIGVSAQKVGVEGGASLARGTARPLKSTNPARYGDLSHPGDAFSFDIYSQVGALLRGNQATEILGGRQLKRLIAIGESQSAFFLATYVNAVDPVAKVYDGFLIHSRSGPAASIDGVLVGAPASVMQQPIKLRSDLRVPVMQVITETDLMGLVNSVGFHAARQPDTGKLRTWEIAGAAHADNYLFGVGTIDSGSASIEQLTAAWAPMRSMQGMPLETPMNNAPQHHYVVEAALWQMDNWLRTGKAPPQAAPIELKAGDAPSFVLDSQGNAKGGVRTPWVDAPTGRLSGIASSPAMGLVGLSVPFDKASLDKLYPGGKSDYMKKAEKSLSSAIAGGFILPADRAEIVSLLSASYGLWSEPETTSP